MCIKIPKVSDSRIERCCLWQRDYEIGRMEQEIAAFIMNDFALIDFSIICMQQININKITSK